MADSDQVVSGLNVFLQKRTAKRVKSLLFSILPTFEFLFALAGDKNGADGLGRPRSPIAVGRINEVSRPMRENLMSARTYMPIVQTTAPSTADAKPMSDYDSQPVVPNWDTTNAPMKRFKQPRSCFSRLMMPYKIPHSEVRTARSNGTTEGQAAAAVGSVYDVEVKNRTAALCKRINSQLFAINGEAGVPTNEDVITWDSLHSFAAAIHDTNTYCGVDRSLSANSWWRGNRVTSAYSGTFYDLIDYCNFDLGMMDVGLGVQVMAVGKTLFKRAKAEAKSESYQLTSMGIPEYPEFGFKREIVRIYNGNRPVYIYYDPSMESAGSTHVLALDPSTWTVAIHPDSNFRVSPPSDQTKNEGGDEADTGTIAAEILVCCEVPKGNAYFTNVA